LLPITLGSGVFGKQAVILTFCVVQYELSLEVNVNM
jgi:hypothetical protein